LLTRIYLAACCCCCPAVSAIRKNHEEGTNIANHGQNTFKGIAERGAPFSMSHIQCTDVTCAFGSVYRLNQAGNSLILHGKNT
jgi:hypothetical protein